MKNFGLFTEILEIRNESIQATLYRANIYGMRVKMEIDTVIRPYYVLTFRGYDEALEDNGSPNR